MTENEHFSTKTIENVTIGKTEIANCVRFSFGDNEETLRLDKEGFHYKGETIKDAGEAHQLFMEWLSKAMKI
jgi:hypothetical protein